MGSTKKRPRPTGVNTSGPTYKFGLGLSSTEEFVSTGIGGILRPFALFICMFLGCLDLMVGSNFSSGETGDEPTMNFPTEMHRGGIKQHISFQTGFYPRDQLQLGRRKQLIRLRHLARPRRSDSSIHLYCIVLCLVLTLANGVVDLLVHFGSEFSSDSTGDGPGHVDDEVIVQDSGVDPIQMLNDRVRLISVRQSDHIERHRFFEETKEEMIPEETKEELNTRRRSGRLLSRARREAEDVLVDATATVRRENRSGARRAATRAAVADATAAVRHENRSGVRRATTRAVSEAVSESIAVDAPAPNHLRAEQVMRE